MTPRYSIVYAWRALLLAKSKGWWALLSGHIDFEVVLRYGNMQ